MPCKLHRSATDAVTDTPILLGTQLSTGGLHRKSKALAEAADLDAGTVLESGAAGKGQSAVCDGSTAVSVGKRRPGSLGMIPGGDCWDAPGCCAASLGRHATESRICLHGQSSSGCQHSVASTKFCM